MSIAGLDVSQWQGTINWGAIPSSYQWVAIRALKGTTLDTRFFANWAGARNRGIQYRLAYAYVTNADMEGQAEALFTLVAPLRPGEGVMLDFEYPSVTNAQATAWLQAIEAATGRPAVVYLGGPLELKIARLPVVGNRALVWPDYRSEAEARASLPGRTWDARQFTDRGSIPGIPKPVDLDRVDNPAAFDAAVGAQVAFAIKPVDRPHCLDGQDNGQLDPAILSPIPSERPTTAGYQMVIPAARAYRAMHAAAKAKGLTLKPVSASDTYRPYTVQEAIFRARYTTTVLPGRPYKTWNGLKWYKKPNVATAATPGTSNHGWGLAVDLGVETDGDVPAESIGTASNPTPELTWLGNNADRFGFSWETLPEEYWHVRHYRGDDLAPDVLAYEAGLDPEPQPQPEPEPLPPAATKPLEPTIKGTIRSPQGDHMFVVHDENGWAYEYKGGRFRHIDHNEYHEVLVAGYGLPSDPRELPVGIYTSKMALVHAEVDAREKGEAPPPPPVDPNG